MAKHRIWCAILPAYYFSTHGTVAAGRSVVVVMVMIAEGTV